MSLNNSKTVDCIGFDKKNHRIVLYVIDAEDWDNEHHHLYLLQEKINYYLSFIESGEIFQTYPRATNKEIELMVIFQYKPTILAQNFFSHITPIIADAGFKISHEVR